MQLKDRVTSASDSINSIKFSLKILETQNDSLKIVLEFLKGLNEKLFILNQDIKKENKDYFVQNQRSIGDVSQKFGYRQFNQIIEKELIKQLKKWKNKSISIELGTSSQEAIAFRDQIGRIFGLAGWVIHGFEGNISFSGQSNKDVIMCFNENDPEIKNGPVPIIVGALISSGYKVTVLDVNQANASVMGFGKSSFTKRDRQKSDIGLAILPFTQKLK